MTSLPSNSNRRSSSAFSRFHEGIQRWIWQQGWTELHRIQEEAAGPILEAKNDLIIAAPTATGKTEAAFCPIVSRLAEQPRVSVGCLCVSPLKALIDDQFRRLESLCACVDMPVHRWHGDVTQSRKKLLLKTPSGILLITPESLEALFIIHGASLPQLFANLEHVVVDELHAFIGMERGRQLQSLLHRIELATHRRIQRIGLSATLGNMKLAAEFLRPASGENTVLIVSEGGKEVRVQLRGYRRTPPRLAAEEDRAATITGQELEVEESTTRDLCAIAADIFKALRGTDNLIFANSRARVEELADLLRRLSEQKRVPNEFLPHHGSLSKEYREQAETLLKDTARPGNVVCTTTLELGIDVGTVSSIAQIGVPPSAAALRQRLGRSGRREDKPAVMRIYISEEDITPQTALQDTIRAELVQTISTVRLLLSRWCEPPVAGKLHLSTLVQQLLSLVAQYGGASPAEVWNALCGTGPFSGVNQEMFATLLRALASHGLISQTHDRALVLGDTGERLVDHYSFYAAFATPEEYRLVCETGTIGSMPITSPVAKGMFLIFAGRRWRITRVDVQTRVIDLVPAAGGRPPAFFGSLMPVHDKVRQDMFEVYCSMEVPVFLDARAQALLIEARESFLRNRLNVQAMVPSGNTTLVFPWRGDRVVNTLLLQLTALGMEVENHGIALAVTGVSPEELLRQVTSLADAGPADPMSLAAMVNNKQEEKYDCYLTEGLLCADYASRSLDVEGAWTTLKQLVERHSA